MKRTSAGSLADACRRAVAAGLLLGLAATVLRMAWRSRGWPLVHDAPIMHYVAWRIGEGAAPYRDLFDMNFPGTYLLHLAVVGLLGPGDAAWRGFDLAWLAAGAVAVAAFAAPWGRAAAGGGALFFAAHHLAGGAGQVGQRDFLLCPFLLLGALGVARWLEQRRASSLAWGGLVLGAGVTIKPHAALLAGTLAVVVALGAWRSGSGVPVAVFGGATALAPLAVVAWIAAVGALPAWRSIVFEYLLPLYSQLARPEYWGFHRWHVWIPIALAVGASLTSAVVSRRFGARHGVAVLGLVYGVVHYVGQGKGWEYHIYPAAAFAAVLLFCELEALLRARRPVAAIALAACLLATVVMLDAKAAEAAGSAETGWIAHKARRVVALARDLRARLAPGDLVQVLDTTGGGIHALLRLHARQPTRFLYDFHFFHDADAPVIRALRDELVRGLDARPPRFVVFFREGWPAGGDERIAAFPELATRLDRGFRLDTRGDGYVIYAKRDDP